MPLKFRPLPSAAGAALLFGLTLTPLWADPAPATSSWVHAGPDGKLVYQTTPAGDRIMDFSFAGYGGGGVALPEVPVVVRVQPSGGPDDTAVIQAAIDQLAAQPMTNGFRGAILLAPGTYVCAQPIVIAFSGIVLRGSGSGTGAEQSTIRMTGGRHTAILAQGRDSRRRTEEAGGTHTVLADAYVASGALEFNVADAGGFHVGDTIELRKPVTPDWIHLMQMEDLTRDGRPQTWLRPGSSLITERRIAALAGNRVTLDVPLSDSFDRRYLNPPGTAVARITPPRRLIHLGIEHLHLESPRQEVNHTEELYTAVRLNGEDCWMRDVAIDETMNSVGVGGRRITLQRVSVTRKARHQGASKPAEFAPNGSQVLLDRCSVTADNVWFVATGEGQAGPIVVLNCDFIGNGRSEAHQRWSTGMLYDNCRAPAGGFEMRNRGSMGSGHGWGMGWGVAWNCAAEAFLFQNPPGALNWLIGCIGRSEAAPRPFGSGPNLPGGTEDSAGHPVAPESLYLTQLAERLGPQALANIGYASTRVESAGRTAAAAPVPAADATPGNSGPPNFGRNLALDRPVLASNVRGKNRDYAAWQALDGDDRTYWATDDGAASPWLELDTEGALSINVVEIAEARGLTGQVQEYKVEGFVDNAWKLLASGTSVGERKIDRFPRVTVWKVRLTLLKAAPYAAIRTFGLYSDDTAAGRTRPPTRLPTAPGTPPLTPVGADPAHPGALRGGPGMNPPSGADGNFLIGPDYVRAPELTPQAGVPKGTVFHLTMKSADSALYPGITKVPPGGPENYYPPDLTHVPVYPKPYTRTVTVYVPASYRAGTPAPVIVTQDGPDANLPTVLDNLIAQHRVPAMVAVMIQNGGGDAQGSERGLEYDTMSGRYAEFVEREVFPLVGKACGVRLSADPDARAAMGGSSGGVAAFTMAWYHPELYHRVITYSGTYVNQASPFNPDTPHGAWEYHEHLIPESPRKPIRLWMEVGDRDLYNPNTLRDGMHDWVEANHRMATVLQAKGYHYQYVFALGAGHTDRNVKAQTLPEALEWVWQGAPLESSP